MPKTVPGQYNTFVRNHEASQGMVVDFSRNPDEFALPKYVQYVSPDKNTGLYVDMNVEMAGRVLSDTGGDVAWPDGAPRPRHNDNLESFEFLPFKTTRYADGFGMGWLAEKQATWDIVQQHSRITAQRVLTRRTVKVVNILTTAGNYAASHQSATIESIAGVTGKADVSTVARSDVKRALDHMADQIRKDTLGAVKPDQLILVVGPGWARKVAPCQEIREYIMQQENAAKYVTDNLGPHNNYGLPEQLYGYNVVVEDAVRINTRKGETATPAYVWDEDVMCMISRPGGLDGVGGAPSFSTITLFFNEEMTVEEKSDSDDRRTEGSIVEDYQALMTASVTGYIIEDSLS